MIEWMNEWTHDKHDTQLSIDISRLLFVITIFSSHKTTVWYDTIMVIRVNKSKYTTTYAKTKKKNKWFLECVCEYEVLCLCSSL